MKIKNIKMFVFQFTHDYGFFYKIEFREIFYLENKLK